MKKGLLFFAMFFAAQLVFGQATRLVLSEEFTQASCPPCASQNPAYNTLLQANTTKTVGIKYQTVWPGYDPMNQQNPDDVANRVTFYGVSGVPTGLFDGIEIANDCGAYAGAPACATQDKIDAAQAITSPIELTLDHTVSADLASVTFTLTMKNVSAAPFGGPGNFIRVALVEDEINFPSQPGTNGEVDFYGVMRKMIPDANGTAMPLALPAGQSVTQTITVPLPTYYYNFNHVAMVAWVQNDDSHEVFQAAYSVPKSLVGYPDLGWERTTAGPATYCDYNLTPGIKITNYDATVVTSFKVDALVNGTIIESKTWTGSLAKDDYADISFANYTIPNGGNYTVDYNVTGINGNLADYNTLNNLPEPVTFSVVSPTAFDTKIVESMEGVTAGSLPTPTVFEGVADHDMIVGDLDFFAGLGLATPPTQPVGAFLTSDKSLWVNLWDMAAGNEASLIWDKIDLSAASATSKLKFDRAYRQYASETDRLKIELSKDCGATWTAIFNKAGTQLKTVAASTTFFVPQTAAQWKSDSAAIPAAFIGESEVLVKVHVISNFGNNLFLDNLNVASGVSATNDPILEAATSIFPNPTDEAVQISLNLPEAMTLSVKITDVAGKEIAQIANTQLFNAGNQTLTFDQFKSSGTYFVTIVSEKGQTSKRLTVIK